MINYSSTKTSLIILLFNANSLKNHVNEILTVLYKTCIDIALINRDTLHQIFPGYITYKSNHPDNTADGGVAIIIKSTLYFSPLPNFTRDYLQCCAVTIKLNNIPITITSIYCPPQDYILRCNKISASKFNDYFSTINFSFI